MNQKNLILFFLAFTISIVSCCKKDEKDSEETTANSFMYEGNEYALAKGYFGDDSEPGTAIIDIILTSNEIAYNASTGLFSGTGEYIDFELYPATGGSITDGTYNFSLQGPHYAEIGINSDYENETGTIEKVTAGNIMITTVGTEKEIDINLTLSNNRKVTGFFRGNITEIY